MYAQKPQGAMNDAEWKNAMKRKRMTSITHLKRSAHISGINSWLVAAQNFVQPVIVLLKRKYQKWISGENSYASNILIDHDHKELRISKKNFTFTCTPSSWALCSISRIVKTSSSDGPSSWRRCISSKVRSTCQDTLQNELKLGHQPLRSSKSKKENWNGIYQLQGDFWITRKINANVTTYIASPWRSITTKKYWNPSGIDLYIMVRTK